jgi:hypothetical protein
MSLLQLSIVVLFTLFLLCSVSILLTMLLSGLLRNPELLVRRLSQALFILAVILTFLSLLTP